MLTSVLIAIGVLVGIFLIFIARQSSAMKISRELLVKAKPETIFPYINNSKKTDEWMPWRDSDPGAKMNYSGPEEGVGSMSKWDSPGKMGAGQAVIVESTPQRVVKTQLTYTRPMQMSQLAEISLTPQDGGTLVRWSVTGKNNFVGRIFCFFMNMDKMVGGEFEKGLAKLKALVEVK